MEGEPGRESQGGRARGSEGEPGIARGSQGAQERARKKARKTGRPQTAGRAPSSLTSPWLALLLAPAWTQ